MFDVEPQLLSLLGLKQLSQILLTHTHIYSIHTDQCVVILFLFLPYHILCLFYLKAINVHVSLSMFIFSVHIFISDSPHYFFFLEFGNSVQELC